MPENRCVEYCNTFKDCSSGELGRQVKNKRSEEEIQINSVQHDYARESALFALQSERNNDEDDLGRIVVFALQKQCKGPSLFRRICRNPYAKRFMFQKANF